MPVGVLDRWNPRFSVAVVPGKRSCWTFANLIYHRATASRHMGPVMEDTDAVGDRLSLARELKPARIEGLDMRTSPSAKSIEPPLLPAA